MKQTPTLLSVEKIQTGSKHLHNYKLKYDNNIQWDLVSRRNSHSEVSLGSSERPDAVTCFVFSKDRKRMLITSEFRYSINGFVQSSAAGLVDPGETIEEAGFRELEEEVGYKVSSVLTTLNGSYSTVGMTDERTASLFVTVDDTVEPQNNLGDGEIVEFQWLEKRDIKKLLDNAHNVTARTQLVMMMFVNGMIDNL